MQQENKLNYVDEITENLKIMIENFDENFKSVYSYQSIKENIETLSKLNTKDYPSLNNKIF